MASNVKMFIDRRHAIKWMECVCCGDQGEPSPLEKHEYDEHDQNLPIDLDPAITCPSCDANKCDEPGCK